MMKKNGVKMMSLILMSTMVVGCGATAKPTNIMPDVSASSETSTGQETKEDVTENVDVASVDEAQEIENETTGNVNSDNASSGMSLELSNLQPPKKDESGQNDTSLTSETEQVSGSDKSNSEDNTVTEIAKTDTEDETNDESENANQTQPNESEKEQTWVQQTRGEFKLPSDILQKLGNSGYYKSINMMESGEIFTVYARKEDVAESMKGYPTILPALLSNPHVNKVVDIVDDEQYIYTIGYVNEEHVQSVLNPVQNVVDLYGRIAHKLTVTESSQEEAEVSEAESTESNDVQDSENVDEQTDDETQNDNSGVTTENANVKVEGLIRTVDTAILNSVYPVETEEASFEHTTPELSKLQINTIGLDMSQIPGFLGLEKPSNIYSTVIGKYPYAVSVIPVNGGYIFVSCICTNKYLLPQIIDIDQNGSIDIMFSHSAYEEIKDQELNQLIDAVDEMKIDAERCKAKLIPFIQQHILYGDFSEKFGNSTEVIPEQTQTTEDSGTNGEGTLSGNLEIDIDDFKSGDN